MEYNWLNRQNNDNLIMFFCGWSFDFKPFERLNCGNNDVLIIYNYSDIANRDFTINSLSHGYKTYSLITWSMGVYAAYLLRDLLPDFKEKIAVNGTPFPVDDEFGIPVKTFDLTLKYVETGLQGKFQKNLFKHPEEYKKYLSCPVERSIENCKEELIALNNYIKKSEPEYKKFYDYAIISDTDKIIPTRNQIKCWENFNTPIKILDSGHFPFFNFNSWDEIIKCNQI